MKSETVVRLSDYDLELPPFLGPWRALVQLDDAGLVRARRRGPLAIISYTDLADRLRCWDKRALRDARGLIVNLDTGEVVACPFPKFLNFDEPFARRVVEPASEGATQPATANRRQVVNVVPPLPTSLPEVTVKLDGSLGISYRDPDTGRMCWASPRSFISASARAAQELWDARYRDREPALFGAFKSSTLLVETIHPRTRQTVAYDFTDLVLIGVRDRFTGRDLPYAEIRHVADALGLRLVERLDWDLDTALARVALLDESAEGVVCRFDADQCPMCATAAETCALCGGTGRLSAYRLKLKSHGYLRYIAVIGHYTPEAIARAWCEGTLDRTLRSMPEEFAATAERVVDTLEAEEAELLAELDRLRSQAPGPECEQKAFALWVQANAPAALWPCLFRIRQGKEATVRAAVVNRFMEAEVRQTQPSA